MDASDNRTQEAAAGVLNVSQKTISEGLNKKGGCLLARKVAAVRGQSFEDLLTGRPAATSSGARVCDLAGWGAAVEEAKTAREYRHIPPYTYDVIAAWRVATGTKLTAARVAALAEAWWKHAPEDELSEAHEAHRQRERSGQVPANAQGVDTRKGATRGSGASSQDR